MLKNIDNNATSYIHDYKKSELNSMLNDISNLGFSGVDGKVSITLDQSLGVGMLGVTHYNYHPKKSSRKRGSYEKKSFHSREYNIQKRAQVKRDLAYFKAVPANQVCTGVVHFNNLLSRPKSPHVALDKVDEWLEHNRYLDYNRTCLRPEYGDNGVMHVHFVACLKVGFKFDTNNHNSQLVKAIQSSWPYGYSSIKPSPYSFERLANYWFMLPYKDDTKPYSEALDKQLVAHRDQLAKKIRALEEAPNTPHKQDKLDELKEQKKDVQEELKRERSKRYPNRNKEVPYRAHLSGFKTIEARVTTQQAMALTALGTFIHGKISVKGMRNINTATGEVGKPILLGTVKLQLTLNREQTKKVLTLQRSFELSNAMNHKS